MNVLRLQPAELLSPGGMARRAPPEQVFIRGPVRREVEVRFAPCHILPCGYIVRNKDISTTV